MVNIMAKITKNHLIFKILRCIFYILATIQLYIAITVELYHQNYGIYTYMPLMIAAITIAITTYIAYYYTDEWEKMKQQEIGLDKYLTPEEIEQNHKRYN